jgi:hypothetical protein
MAFCNLLLKELENNYKASLQKDIKSVTKLLLYDFLSGNKKPCVYINLDDNCVPKYFNMECVFEKKWGKAKRKCVDGAFFITKCNKEVCCCFFEFKATLDNIEQIVEFKNNLHELLENKIDTNNLCMCIICLKVQRVPIKKKLKINLIKSGEEIHHTEICNCQYNNKK